MIYNGIPDEFQIFVCSKSKCGWRGKEDERGKEQRGIGTYDVCPRCGNDSFYIRDLRKVKTAKPTTDWKQVAADNERKWRIEQAAKQQAEQEAKRLFESVENATVRINGLVLAKESAEQKTRALEAALKEIANHKFTDYYAAHSGIYKGQYGIGVVDGHRSCAIIARKALNPDDHPQSLLSTQTEETRGE